MSGYGYPEARRCNLCNREMQVPEVCDECDPPAAPVGEGHVNCDGAEGYHRGYLEGLAEGRAQADARLRAVEAAAREVVAWRDEAPVDRFPFGLRAAIAALDAALSALDAAPTGSAPWVPKVGERVAAKQYFTGEIVEIEVRYIVDRGNPGGRLRCRLEELEPLPPAPAPPSPRK